MLPLLEKIFQAAVCHRSVLDFWSHSFLIIIKSKRRASCLKVRINSSVVHTWEDLDYSLTESIIGFYLDVKFNLYKFPGAMWGFGPMQLLLEEHGAFHSLCPSDYDAADYDPDNPHNVCPEQAARLITA